MKNQVKIIALLLLAAFLANGCQREDFQKDLEHGHATEQSIPFSFKRKTFEQLKNDPKFSGAYDKVSQKVKEQDLANAKTVMEDQYGFVIDSTLIKEVSSDSYVSYTFLIHRETPSEGFFENLVVDVDSLDNIRAYIVKYTPNSPSVYIPEDDAYSLDATAEITPIDFNDQQVQSKVSYTDGNGCLVTLMCPYGGTPHPAGPACIAAERGNLYWSAPACPNDGYGNNYPDYSGGIGNGGGSGNNNNNNNGGSGNNPSPHPGGNGSGNNNGNNNNNNLPVITDPVVDGEQNPQCLALTQVAQLVSALGLNSGQAAMIRSNCAFGSQLYDYLNNGGDEAFAIAAVEAMPDGEVDWDDEVILDSTFVSSSVHCIHNKMKSNSANIYSNMLSHFSSTTQKNITFSIGSSIGTDWGITNGNPSIPNDYNIIIHENIIENNGSNLMRYVALCHELIHAFMFDSLEDVGLITFDSTGSPILNVNCPTSNVNLNALNVKDRFVSLICAMNTAGILTQDWSHDLFNSTVFSIQDYRQQLENLILNDYDWNNEGAVFVNNAVSTFGTNWKQEVAKAVSWIGLENTDEYSTYLNSYSTQPMKFLYINDIRNIISVTNNNCP